MRTVNNPKWLRSLIERTKAEGKELWTAFVDLTKAFDLFLRDAAWVKLSEKGAAGPVFDITRRIYKEMKTAVRFEGESSASPFSSMQGVLQGDPLSPMLWILFMSDLSFPDRADDPELCSVPFSHAVHADNTCLVSTSPEGLQARLDQLARWCARNGAIPNPGKSKVVGWNRKKRPEGAPDPLFSLNGQSVPLCTEDERYIGVLFEADEPLRFRGHHQKQADSARRVAQSVFSLRFHLGQLDPVLFTQHYKQQVDPLLTWGAEVMADAPETTLKAKMKIQLEFFRRLLGVSPKSSRLGVLGEVGILPIKERILSLYVRDLAATLSLPLLHPAFLALMDSAMLAQQRKRGYYHNMTRILADYGIALPAVPSATLFSEQWVEDCTKKIKAKVVGDYDAKPYLKQPQPGLRRSMAKMRLSSHRLAVELGRHAGVDRERRACRICEDDVEDEEHALLRCEGSPYLGHLRSQLVERLSPALRGNRRHLDRALLERLPDVSEPKDVAAFLFFVHRTLSFFDLAPPLPFLPA
ncbi:hypothetical protein JCM6882_002229 [Rhodosporidiobolus microsporus]